MHSCASLLGDDLLLKSSHHSLLKKSNYKQYILLQQYLVKSSSWINGKSTFNESLKLHFWLLQKSAFVLGQTRHYLCTVWLLHYITHRGLHNALFMYRSSQQFQVYLVSCLVTSRIGVLQHHAYSGVCQWFWMWLPVCPKYTSVLLKY